MLVLLLKAPTKFNSYLLKHQKNMTIAKLLTVSIFSIHLYQYVYDNKQYIIVQVSFEFKPNRLEML